MKKPTAAFCVMTRALSRPVFVSKKKKSDKMDRIKEGNTREER